MKLRRVALRRKTDLKTGKAHFVRACAVEMHMDRSQEIQEAFCGNLGEKCRTRIPRQAFLCEPAQSKCTWTRHKRHFV